MASTPVIGPAPIVSLAEPAEKIDGEVAAEVVMKQSEFMKLGSGEPGEKSFVWPEGQRPDIPYDQYDVELPVIDLSPVLKLQSLRREIEQMEGGANTRRGLETEIEACEAAKSHLAKAIRAACEEYGFFQIINSGFPMEVVDQFRECCRAIFDLSLEEKMKTKDLPVLGLAPFFGYKPMKSLHASSRMKPAHSWLEVFDLETPEAMFPGTTEKISSILWPGELENSTKGHLLRSTTEEYAKQSSRVIFSLLDLIGASLGIPQETVNSLLGDREKEQVGARLRANNYPLCDHPELTWGITSHTDPVLLTLLHQDAVGGLQIRFRDGTWHGVRPRPDVFVINCGDLLQAWTNGRLLSAEHRVVANEKSRRMSIVYFARIDIDYVLSPRPECVDAEHPLRYKPFTMRDYVKELTSLGLGTERGEVLDRAFGTQL